MIKLQVNNNRSVSITYGEIYTIAMNRAYVAYVLNEFGYSESQIRLLMEGLKKVDVLSANMKPSRRKAG